jgi:hypothetical protein
MQGLLAEGQPLPTCNCGFVGDAESVASLTGIEKNLLPYWLTRFEDHELGRVQPVAKAAKLVRDYGERGDPLAPLPRALTLASFRVAGVDPLRSRHPWITEQDGARDRGPALGQGGQGDPVWEVGHGHVGGEVDQTPDEVRPGFRGQGDDDRFRRSIPV